MNKEEAIDILANCIDDYVIGDFCVGKFCPMENECKDKECVFHLAIETVLNLIKKQQVEIEKKDKVMRAIIKAYKQDVGSHSSIKSTIEHFEKEVEAEEKRNRERRKYI